MDKRVAFRYALDSLDDFENRQSEGLLGPSIYRLIQLIDAESVFYIPKAIWQVFEKIDLSIGGYDV